MTSAVPSYDARYAEGGWNYKKETELPQLEILLNQAGLKPPASIIEVACGMGFHTNLMHEMGYRVVGNDYSEVGITEAEKRYPEIKFHFGDSMLLPEKLGKNRFDGVMARGHSHHHYDLPTTGRSRKDVDVVASTRSMFDLAKPGGFVMMTIRTDFTGGRYKDGVHNNTLAAYRDLFSLFGEIIALTDRYGTAIKNHEHALELGKKPDNRVNVVTRKPL